MAMCALLWISINKLYRDQLGEARRGRRITAIFAKLPELLKRS